MIGSDSTPSVLVHEAKSVAVSETAGGNPGDGLGQLLQSFRTYLLTVARQELNVNLRGKCGESDVVQETFLEAHRDWNGFRGKTRADVRAWLRGILVNNVRDVARGYQSARRRGNREAPRAAPTLEFLVDPGLTPCAHASAEEEAAAVARAIAGLADDHRRVIELRSRENRGFQEIGQILGRSPDAARMLWFRAIESLRRELVPGDGS